MAKIDKEEQELKSSVENGEWQPVHDKDKEVFRYREIARSTFRKDRRVNIRISSKDLEALQKRALEEGIPYQTLMSSVLHKYVTGRFLDRGSAS